MKFRYCKQTFQDNGKAEIYAVQIPDEAKSVGMTIRKMAQNKKFHQDCVFIGIYSKADDNFSVPRGDHMLNKWDTVFLISPSGSVNRATDFLTKK
ncbi:MAG: TrkA C-terminal domain-containing protein [Desulfobacterales bacterium]